MSTSSQLSQLTQTRADISPDIDIEKGFIQEGDDQYIMIGKSKVHIDQISNAFGGTFRAGYKKAPGITIANPSPLGLSSFALTTFVLSIINFQGLGVTKNNIVIGLAFFYGGGVQLLAGMWEFVCGNTFGATAFSSYGGFWMAWGAIGTPAFGIADAYADDAEMKGHALGFFLLGWTIFSVGLTLCTVKGSVSLFILFFLLSITFTLLTIGDFCLSTGSTKAGGILGLIVSIIAWYNAYAGVASPDNSYITVKTLLMPGAPKKN